MEKQRDKQLHPHLVLLLLLLLLLLPLKCLGQVDKLRTHRVPILSCQAAAVDVVSVIALFCGAAETTGFCGRSAGAVRHHHVEIVNQLAGVRVQGDVRALGSQVRDVAAVVVVSHGGGGAGGETRVAVVGVVVASGPQRLVRMLVRQLMCRQDVLRLGLKKR